jgi:hypothetical protein
MAEDLAAAAAMRAQEIVHVLGRCRAPGRRASDVLSVETMTAPASGTCCAIVSCASPVPGGMSTIMMLWRLQPTRAQATERTTVRRGRGEHIEEPMPPRCRTFIYAELAGIAEKGKRHAGSMALSGLKSSVVVGGPTFRKADAAL